ncbi:MAG: hypothetical protein WCO33_02370 [bacterium]
MPEKSNKKIIVVFVVIFVLILAALAVFIALRLSSQNITPTTNPDISSNTTKIGGNLYCIGSDGNKVFALNTGKIRITDTGKYPAGASSQKDITVVPNQDGSWSSPVDWASTSARYNVSYFFDDTTLSLANGVKILDLKNKSAINCATPSKIGSTDGTGSASSELKPACVDSSNLCPSDTDKTSYNECKLNGSATDKKNGYTGFDFVFDSCGNPVSSDVSVKLSSNSVFLPAGQIELVTTVKNNSKDKMFMGDLSPLALNFANTASYLDSFDITCTAPDGKTDCGKISDSDKGEYKFKSLEGNAEYQVILTGKLKSSLKLLDKISINVEAKLATGYVDMNYDDNKATIEKTITVDGKQCSDSKLAWETNICWGNVKMDDSGTYVFNDCKKGETCDTTFKKLTESQLCMYLNWVNNSKPNINGCPETSTVIANVPSQTSSAFSASSSIVTINLQSSSSSKSSSSSSSSATIIPATTSSSSSSSVASVSSSSSSSRSSSKSSSISSVSSSSKSSVSSNIGGNVNEKLPTTAVEPTQIIAWIAVLLIAFGFISYKFFFAEANYGKVDNIRLEVKKKTYLTKVSIKEQFQTNLRKVKWETSYAINKALLSLKKLDK